MSAFLKAYQDMGILQINTRPRSVPLEVRAVPGLEAEAALEAACDRLLAMSRERKPLSDRGRGDEGKHRAPRGATRGLE